MAGISPARKACEELRKICLLPCDDLADLEKPSRIRANPAPARATTV